MLCGGYRAHPAIVYPALATLKCNIMKKKMKKKVRDDKNNVTSERANAGLSFCFFVIFSGDEKDKQKGCQESWKVEYIYTIGQ